MFKRLKKDIEVVMARDPAARSIAEVLFCYPGLHAIWGHRLAHFFFKHNRVFIARAISHLNRFFTGIEIHPGAILGEGLFIDHGMGIVIGETTIMGENVTLYKGVVLGGTGKEKGKRHPTLGNNVVVSSNAIVLGNITLGNNVKIGAGSVVLINVPDDCTVVGVPGRIVRAPEHDNNRQCLEDGRLPDPIFEALRKLQKEIDCIEKEISKKEKVNGD